MKLKVLSILGTRPEAIKMVPVIRALEERSERVESRVCVTAQHRDILDQMLRAFSIRVDHDLDLMLDDQSPIELIGRIVDGVRPVLEEESPDWVLVQGDTTTTMAASLAAGYYKVAVGHVEAGLRTQDKRRPFPEEMNRRVTAALANLHFAPTMTARTNLLFEGVAEERIVVTGNPVIDTLFIALSIPVDRSAPDGAFASSSERLILVTAHRRENFGRPLREVCAALIDIASAYRDEVRVVYPVHPNPNVRKVAFELLSGVENIALLDPMGYIEWVHLMAASYLILTDSGGIQEEAPSLGRPVLVLRDLTERPEAVEAGAARVVGTSRRRIVQETVRLLEDRSAYETMSRRRNLYGDGGAARRVVSALLGERVPEWLPEKEQQDAFKPV